MSHPEQSSALDLEARYGRTPSSKRRAKWIAIASAVVFALVVISWLAWAGLTEAPDAQFEAKDVGHQIVSDSETTVTWNFTTEPGNSARCAVQALNSTFAIVGWDVVDVPADERRTRQFTTDLLTTEEAVSGLIYRCWLT